MSLTKKVKGSVKVLIGLQYGDEGKGKITDSTAEKYQVIARFNGGDNAGHTLEFNGEKHIVHLIPSGAFHKDIKNVIGNGVAVNPISLIKESNYLATCGVDIRKNLFISDRAPLLTCFHVLLDQAEEKRLGKKKIGSTLKGIGPVYRDNRGRQGLKVGDILSSGFMRKLKKFEAYQMADLKKYKQFGFKIDTEKILEAKKLWMKSLKQMKEFIICDTSHLLKLELEKGSKILAEGAQSVMLDINFGDYPNVTSSDTITWGAALGLGIPVSSIVSVAGVIKSYSTKVGGGKFIARMKDKKVERKFQRLGKEFGSTTKRLRACGWLDLFALKHAIFLSDATKIYMNKVDICPTDTVIVITGYIGKDGKLMKSYPRNLSDVKRWVTKEFDGWGDTPFNKHDIQTFPPALLNYLNFIHNELVSVGAKLAYVGTGAERNDFVKWD